MSERSQALALGLVPRTLKTPNGGMSVYGADCAQLHTALIMDRGGVRKRWQLVDLSYVEWGREEDGKTQAVIRIQGRACRAQQAVTSKIRSRRHEVRLFRGSTPVWEGPIIHAESDEEHVEIICNDIIEYLDGTALSVDWPISTGVPAGPESWLMTQRIATIIDHELTVPYDMIVGTGAAAQTVTVPRWEAIETPANVLPYVDIRHSDTLLTRSSTQAKEMSLGEHLYNLGRGGLNYTTVGRSLIIWDSHEALGRTRVLTAADFTGDMSVIEAGEDHFSISHISATREEDDSGGVTGVGNAGGEDPYYGVWTNIVSLSSEEGSSEPTQDALNSQAQRDQVGRTPPPLTLRVADGAGLRLSQGLTINHLVPGTVMPVRATVANREVKQDQILSKMKVTETSGGEVVEVTLIPSGVVESA